MGGRSAQVPLRSLFVGLGSLQDTDLVEQRRDEL
jgi:hypothetical protein